MKSKKKSDRRIKRKSSVKKTWEKFIERPESRSLLRDAWKIQKDDQKEYTEKIYKLHKKYTQ